MPALQPSASQREPAILPRLHPAPNTAISHNFRGTLAQGIAFLALATAARSWSFHYSVIDWDESVYLVIAQGWLSGGLPYVDVWDSHPVGLPALFALLGVFREDMLLAVRVAAAVATGLVAVLLSYSARRHFSSPLGGWFAGAFYVLAVSGVSGLPANTEIFNNLLITAGAIFLLDAWCQRGHWQVPFCGLCFGAALQLKYQVIPEVALMSLLYLWLLWSRSGVSRAAGHAAVLLVTGLAPTFAVVWYYLMNDQLGAFLDANVRANLSYVALAFDAGDLAQRLSTGLKPLLAPGAAVALLVLPPIRALAPDAPKVMWIWLGVWFFAACLDVLAPLKFWPHYFLVLAPPLCLLAGLSLGAAWRLGTGMGRTARGFGLLLLAATIAIDVRDAFILREKWASDIPREIASEILGAADANRGIYVYDYQPVIYYLTNVRAPSRFVLPVELSTFSRSAGVDGLAELKRILATRPRYIVVANPAWPEMPAHYNALVASVLTDYTLHRAYPGETGHGALLYRRRLDQ